MKRGLFTLLFFCLFIFQYGYAECYVLKGESCTVAYSSESANSTGTYSDVFELPYAGKSLTFNYKLKSNANNWHTLSVEWSKDKNTWNTVANWTSGKITDANALSKTLNLSQEARYIRFKRTANAEKGFFGWKNVGKVAFNVSAINVVMADRIVVDKTALDFPRTPINTESVALDIAVRFQNAGTAMSVKSNSDEFVASIKDGSNMDDCLGTKTLQVVFKPTTIGDKKTATITVETNAGCTQTIAVSGSASNIVEPEHTFTGRTLYQVDETINLAEVWTSTSTAARLYSVVDFVPANADDGGTEPTIAADNTLSLTQAGTLVLQLKQAATEGFYESTTEQTITIIKYDLTATISQSAATWDATINNPFAISYDLNDYTVEALDPAIATYTDGAIQTYAETGTARFVISRAENYKYNQLAETLSISVAPAQQSCYVLEQVSDVSINSYDGAQKYNLSGVGEELSVLVHKQSAGTQGFTIKGYDANGNATTLLDLSNSAIPTSYGSPITRPVPASIVRIEVTSGGTLNKYYKELRITRANYLTPSVAEVSMSGTISTIGTNAEAKVGIDYSSCGGTVKVVSDNPKITVSPTSFNAEGSGTQEITLTGDATVLGTETATITIYDQSKKTTINVTSTINRIPQTIAWQSSFENLDVFSTVRLGATASGLTEVVYSIAEGEQEKASIAGNVLSFNEAGTVHVVATAAQSDIYEGVSDTVSVVVSLAQPVVSVFPTVEAVVYGTALTNAMLQGGVAKYGETTVEGSFAWADEQITEGLTPNTYSFNVRFTPANAKHYSTADCSVGVTVNKAQQTISWQSSFENLDVFSTVRLGATASGSTEVVYSIAEGEQGKASIADNVLSFKEAGTVHVVATAAQSDIYESVSDTVSAEVSLAQPVVSVLPTVEAVAYGTALTDAMLQGGVAKYGETMVEGSFAWADEQITDGLTPNTYSFNVHFTPADATHYSTADCAVDVTVNKAQQTISWQSSFEDLNVFSTVRLNATASGSTEVVYSIAEGEQEKASIAGNMLSFNKAGTVHVVATAAQSDIYESVSDTVSVEVRLAQPVVSVLPTVEAVAYGTALTNAMLQGGVAKYGETTVEGSFAWADEKITEGLTPNTYSFNVRFTPADAKHYSTADCSVGVTVNKAQQTISWQSSFEDLDVQSEVILSATAQTAVRFAVSDTAVATITGDRLRFLKAGTIDVVAIAEGSDLYEEVADTIKGIVIARIDPVVSQWPSATLTYGETLTGVVLAGEAVEKGVFQWGDTITDGDLVAVQIAGEYTYAVKFVPTEGGLFNTLYGKATITIVKATQTISWENAPTACKVGERIALEAVASSGLAVEYYVDQIDKYAMIDAERNELVALAKGAIQLRVRQAGEAGMYAAAEDLVLTISIEAGNTTATEQVSANEQVMVRKVLRDGVLYILRGGMCYDINGRLIGAE